MNKAFTYCDDLGPEKNIEIYDPQAGLRAVLVIDNTARGPAIGGVRMAPDVTVEECVRLARAMTLKNAAAGIPHGGGKSVIVGDPAADEDARQLLVRSFAHAIEKLDDYIPGPDMGTNETAMAWIRDEIGRAAGLPREVGGIPLDDIGITGFGVTVAIEVAQEFCDLELEGARVAVQGFGAVGKHAARFLSEKGAILVAASDSRGMCGHPDGLDVAALIRFKEDGHSVGEFDKGQSADRDAILDVDCDIWIPAARPDVLTADNADRIKARVIAEGANIPATLEAERMLADRGVLVLPDFIANAGGVICAAVEWAKGTESQAMAAVDEKIRTNIREVLTAARDEGKLPRDAALSLARARVLEAMSYHRPD